MATPIFFLNKTSEISISANIYPLNTNLLLSTQLDAFVPVKIAKMLKLRCVI